MGQAPQGQRLEFALGDDDGHLGVVQQRRTDTGHDVEHVGPAWGTQVLLSRFQVAGGIIQIPVDPSGLQSGIIGGRQVGANQVRERQRDCIRHVFRLNKRIGAENISGFYWPTVLV